MFEEAAYAALELTLEPGDRHILYTDGILEATNRAQEMYGADRFVHFMKSNKSLSADPFADLDGAVLVAQNRNTIPAKTRPSHEIPPFRVSACYF